jgi:hypothetical protein
MSQPSSIDMSSSDPVDVADPRYISLVMPGFGMDDRYFDQYDVPEEKKRITRFYPRVLDLAKLNLARKEVLETCKLLENILSFLPAKNIFGGSEGLETLERQHCGINPLAGENVSATTRKQATKNLDSGNKALGASR